MTAHVGTTKFFTLAERLCRQREGDVMYFNPSAAEHVALSEDDELRRQTEEVRISSLRIGESPRRTGLDREHVRTLAEVQDAVPPILVNRRTMQVVDGLHRLNAAQLKGLGAIRVRFIEGSDDDAFFEAVRANVAHGLPLSLADRRVAAERIAWSHPRLSDRAIATATGLAPKTVATIRHRATGKVLQSDTRIGRDGRVRPLSTVEGRRAAVGLIRSRPDASLREIAKKAGISVGTVRDVRDRLRAGKDPIPPQQREKTGVEQAASPESRDSARPGESTTDVKSILHNLERDPSLRYTDPGRRILRWVSLRTLTRHEWRALIQDISPHCAILVSKLARECSEAWSQFADELERRGTECA
jgi:ParB-like chromosome segregation protein Spo0J